MPSRTNPVPAGSLIEQFEQLSHPLRVRIIMALNNRNQRKSGEFTSKEFAGSGDDAERLNIDIVHNHLPKLGDAGFINWDRETDTVTKGLRFDELSALLDFIDDQGDGRTEGQF
jgi:hypothetical protein